MSGESVQDKTAIRRDADGAYVTFDRLALVGNSELKARIRG